MRALGLGVAAALGSVSAPALASEPAGPGLRIASYNITSYSGSAALDDELATVFYGSFNGRVFQPDVVLLQEIQSQTAINRIVTVLNAEHLRIYGEPGTWTAGQFFSDSDGSTGDTCMIYRSSRVSVALARIRAARSTSANPRNVIEYQLRPVGYTATDAMVHVVPIHMKAGSTSSDVQRRQAEATTIRAITGAAPRTNWVIGGDFNMPSAGEQGYNTMTAGAVDGRLFDPAIQAGGWNNSSTYRVLHTQDPSSSGGGMDDRFDQLLVTASLRDGTGVDYIGSLTTPFSLTNFNDPNHSYRTWGNDGASCCNSGLRTTGNTAVGPTIAQALITLASGNGHIPVYMDLRMPAEIGTSGDADAGVVTLGQIVTATVTVTNTADASLWGTGVDGLTYAIAGGPGVISVTPPSGELAVGASRVHTIELDASAVGPIDTTLTITSDAVDSPSLTVRVTGDVVTGCIADANFDGLLNIFDILTFFQLFSLSDPGADLAPDGGDGVLDIFDIQVYFNLFAQGC